MRFGAQFFVDTAGFGSRSEGKHGRLELVLFAHGHGHQWLS